jgi:hypothetical protein
VSSCIPPSYSFSGAGVSSRPKIKKRKVQRAHDEDEIVSKEEVVPQSKSRRQLSQEAKAVQKAAKDAKLCATKMDKWSEHDYITMRMKNPYAHPRNPREVRNPYFHTTMQERISIEVYGKKKVCLGPMHSINVALMDKYPEYFGEAKEICEEFGLLPFMQFNHDIDEDIIAQFSATVHLDLANERELIWMTKDKLMKATWAQFGECLG